MMVSMKYLVHFYQGDKVLAEVKRTQKTISIEMLDKPHPRCGCEDVLKKGKYTIRLNVPKGVPRDCVYDWGDGSFTVYFSREGIPTYFEPMVK